MLSVRGVDVTLDGVPVLFDVSLSVDAGETCAVLGPSGCGKSTLLRAIAGLVTPTSGTIHLAGRDAARIPVEARGVGLMFQEHALFPHLTVAGNVAFGLKMRGLRGSERSDLVLDALALVGLNHLASRRVSQLSGGERQRVALARTLAPKPDVVLLDEPLGALDRQLRDRLLDQLPAIFAAANTTAVYVTHDHSEAERIASRIAVMTAGRIDRHDTPAALWRDPVSVFTAQFLGIGAVFPAADSSRGVTTPFGPLFGGTTARGVLLPYEALRIAAPASITVSEEIAAPARVIRALFQTGRRHVQVAFADGVMATVACDDRSVSAGANVTIACPRERITVLRR